MFICWLFVMVFGTKKALELLLLPEKSKAQAVHTSPVSLRRRECYLRQIRVYYKTPAGKSYKQARYVVQTEKNGTRWLPEQVDDRTTNGKDGCAGNLGEAITSFELGVDRK